MTDSVTGIILAGGRSTRMGRDKAALVLYGASLLERVTQALLHVADDIIIVGRQEGDLSFPATFLPDDVPESGPLGGLLTGLRAARHRTTVVVGCDYPFVNSHVLSLLLGLIADHDAAVPLLQDQAQPLHAVYDRSAIPAIEQQLLSCSYAMKRVLTALDVCYVNEAEIALVDPTFRSFINVNTPDDWEKLQVS